MFNGIKPTRLWHLTSRKYFDKMILDRQKLMGKSWEQRDRHDFLQFVAIQLSAVAGVLFSLGWFERPLCPGSKVEDDKNKKATSDPACDREKILERCSESEEKSRRGRKK